MKKAQKIFSLLEQEFHKNADIAKAEQQEKYMRCQMSYYGVTIPKVRLISKAIFKDHAPEDAKEYRETLMYLFENAKYREFWYSGVEYADTFKNFIKEENLDIYIKIIKFTAWWDIVDHLAANIVGKALSKLEKEKISNYAKLFIQDEHLWVRRTGLLLQLKYKENTDFDLLKELILEVAHEKDFFMRKAIGWALRQYSYTNPEIVVNFIEEKRDVLSPLSIREGLKVVNRKLKNK